MTERKKNKRAHLNFLVRVIFGLLLYLVMAVLNLV